MSKEILTAFGGRPTLPELLDALAGRVRLEIVESLAQGPKNVSALADHLQRSVAEVSDQLGQLRGRRMVDFERDARYHVYRLTALWRCMVRRDTLHLCTESAEGLPLQLGLPANRMIHWDAQPAARRGTTRRRR